MYPHLCQLAFTTKHPHLCRRFYKKLLGYQDSGERAVHGIAAARIFRCKTVRAQCYWLTGDDPFFQLEIFHFEQPHSTDNTDNMLTRGYNMLFIEAPSLDEICQDPQLAPHMRQICRYHEQGTEHLLVRDIDNNILDIFSSSTSRTLTKPTLRGIGATVSDLDSEVAHFTKGFGLSECTTPAHFDPQFKRLSEQTQHSEMTRRSKALVCGSYHLQLTQYSDTCAHHTKAPTDQGVLNIALGIREHADFAPLYQSLLDAGYQPLCLPMGDAISNSAYVHSASLSVELLQLPTHIQARWGFPALESVPA
ncbi:hypothetical protein Q3O60_12275 [Alkalimonas collagenimarina]|uniref:VOC domain-containing protein n=1 Tax=Alkalimonas collagenimarina TaxID=400390 RepID=A0ABT9H102_9GAMM|nr:hypothetical protein [Alkalimonas collagenimarina]MDP4536970.1 hypothetical protein [Alkalimonas collagenimarina]